MRTMRLVDLHLHSNASDGTMSPAHLAQHAVDIGLAAAALTDHDSISGLDDFVAAAAGSDMQAVPGVEISAMLSNREIHIVGLFIDWKEPGLIEFLAGIREKRNSRNEKIVHKLRSLGYEISMDELVERAGGESIGRPHIASILIEKAYFKDNTDAFEQCLKRGRPGYCRRELPSPQEAIEAVHQAGGIAIWAHPVYRNKYARSHVRGLLNKLKPLGLDGIEAFYPGFTPAQEKMICELAEIYELQLSGGSDFHGANIPQIAMGSGNGSLKVPEEVFSGLEHYWKSMKSNISCGDNTEETI